ncbi:hypothetical protein Mnod_0877 [Methylobacterium nodulans ORS 2060]|uniref:Uncharacterized protein n=1 Tax=Methylobacterium nodulans (strain LMG 21967 / CNCM I-2342 / ORS 2060) TaxID=460265 RepID=B8IGK1_METNO|nr:hypothetical protein Mnod_0877 [Methylobacterium nodulans ORS 2060]
MPPGLRLVTLQRTSRKPADLRPSPLSHKRRIRNALNHKVVDTVVIANWLANQALEAFVQVQAAVTPAPSAI